MKVKRLLSVLLVLCVVLAWASVEVKAAEIVDGGNCGADGDNLSWSLASDGTLTISGEGDMCDFTRGTAPWYSKRSSVHYVTITEGVTSIGDYSFYDCSNLRSVDIPDGVTKIGDSAFEACCYYLKEVSLPNSVISIGSDAFYYCITLQEIIIPDSVRSIGEYAFFRCFNLQQVTLGAGTSEIGNQAFGVCWCTFTVSPENMVFSNDEYGSLYNKEKTELIKAISANIPESVITIGESAFADLGITGIEIHQGVEVIGESAFADCHSLTSVTIPESVTTIGEGAFWQTISLLEVSVDPDNNYYSSDDAGVLFDKSKSTLIHAPFGIPDDYSMPETVKIIESWAFHDCCNLTSITISENIEEIGMYSFDGCEKLERIVFEGNAPQIMDHSFHNVVTTAYYPLGNESWIADVMKNYGGNITWVGYEPCTFGHSYEATVTMPTCTEQGFTTYTCTNCGESYIADYTEALGHDYKNDICTRCDDIHEDAVASGVCGEKAQWVLSHEGTLMVFGEGEMAASEGGPANIPWRPYTDQIHTIVVEDGITLIDGFAFCALENVTSVTIPGSVTTIGAYAFRDCTSLEEIDIPEGVVSLGDVAFWDCTALKRVELPDSLECIGIQAFDNCWLTEIEIPQNVSSIGEDAFSNCTDLTAIRVSEQNMYYSSDSRGVLFDKEKTTLIFAPRAISGEYIVPESVKTIESNAFSGCAQLTRVNIPSGVSSIGEYAFYNCTGLEQAELSENLEAIPYGLFLNCTSLLEIDIPDRVKSIGPCAFSGCTSLLNAEIGLGVECIDYDAFYGCSSLTTITIPERTNSLGVNPFAECSSLTAIYSDSPNYKTDEYGVLYDAAMTSLLIAPGALSGTYVIPDGVERINLDAFLGCSSLQGVTIPDSVVTMEQSAFENCTALENVTLSSNLATIDAAVFRGCTRMTSVTLPESVTTIGIYAFEECTSLKTVEMTDSVTGILGFAFSGCSSLETIRLSENVAFIDWSAFAECVSLTEIVIPASVTDIQLFAFSDCSSLDSIVFKGDAPTIDMYAFSQVTADAYYPAGNATWTADVMQDYSGTITWVPSYPVIGENNSQWTEGSSEPLAVHVDADIAKFIEVQINGEVIDSENYTVTEGSTIVTLKPEYLATFPSGEYTMTIVFTDGSATATFTVEGSAVILGDVNGDGVINMFDAAKIVAHYTGSTQLTEEQQAAADINNDGVINMFDAAKVVSYYTGKVSSF